ncbi:HIT family protein [Paenibacillus xylanilyticus]|uniref:HIT domain-containing protein n=1 Tax=Paenibacillus xylanilyticus TaxID=248903 RepID=A0A7Y6EWZ6_9BACL|nr:HIT domain-containing protein [Paenibacillus xylanilyticus]NUU79852.1 HIT domain-containing protein [Paenibacillus xylanilyticus]
MTQDFYCDEVLSGKTKVEIVMETDTVLAYHHTRPYYEHHIVVIPKNHIQSLISEEEENNDELLLEIMRVIKKISAGLVEQTGAAKIVTNLGRYQDSKHQHWHVVSGDRIMND